MQAIKCGAIVDVEKCVIRKDVVLIIKDHRISEVKKKIEKNEFFCRFKSEQ